MAHITITLFPRHLQTVQSLLSIERGTEVSHCTPITPQFHGTREAQCPHCGVYSSVFHRVSQVMVLGADAKKGKKEWFGKGTVLVSLPSTANPNDHNWLCSEPWSENRSPHQKEGLWGVGEEQPLSFHGHRSGVAHVHRWQPTVSHPSAHYGQAKSDLQHGVGTMV